MKSLFFRFFLIVALFHWSCNKKPLLPNYRQPMRDFVERISTKAKLTDPDFMVIPQNGLELFTDDGTVQGEVNASYLNAIDGVGQEELFYGYENQDDQTTPEPTHTQLFNFCKMVRDHGKKVLVIDYCSTPQKMNDSYTQNFNENFISFAADHRELDNIPSYGTSFVNATQIDSLYKAQNFLYLISPSSFASKQELVDAIATTDYDLVIVDLFFDENTMFSSDDLVQMKLKANGGSRKVVAYMSIGEAEDYRYYWKPWWNAQQPSFIDSEDPDWVDNYYVHYWDPEWQNLICGDGDSYLNRIMNAGFDGVYLDLVSAYEFFEQ